MKHSKFNLRSLFIVLVLVGSTLVSQAQPGGPDDEPGGAGPDPDPAPPQSQDIPFDGGLSLVAVAGVAYAAKKGYDKRKKTDTASNG